jgi:hypothetical protein
MSRLDSLVRSYRRDDLERRYDAKIPPHMLAHAERGPVTDDDRRDAGSRYLGLLDEIVIRCEERGKSDAAEKARDEARALRGELDRLMGDAFGPRACEPSPSVSALRAAPAIAMEIGE